MLLLYLSCFFPDTRRDPIWIYKFINLKLSWKKEEKEFIDINVLENVLKKFPCYE